MRVGASQLRLDPPIRLPRHLWLPSTSPRARRPPRQRPPLLTPPPRHRPPHPPALPPSSSSSRCTSIVYSAAAPMACGCCCAAAALAWPRTNLGLDAARRRSWPRSALRRTCSAHPAPLTPHLTHCPQRCSTLTIASAPVRRGRQAISGADTRCDSKDRRSAG